MNRYPAPRCGGIPVTSPERKSPEIGKVFIGSIPSPRDITMILPHAKISWVAQVSARVNIKNAFFHILPQARLCYTFTQQTEGKTTVRSHQIAELHGVGPI